jgi:predicted secreted hydrolase
LAPAQPPEVQVSGLPSISFPSDEFPHSNLTEWWYFTGHLLGRDAREFGFEFVIFQGLRGDSPRSYAAHFAITDFIRQTFTYDQRTSASHGAAISDGLDLCVGGWTLRKFDRGFAINATMDGHSLGVVLVPTKSSVLQNETGKLDFSPFGWSYYYSYPRLEMVGNLQIDGRGLDVGGSAWMDHQWGDFINVGSGGWDWFGLQLDDGRDFTASVVRDSRRETVLRYGTLIDAFGASTHLYESDFSMAVNDTWLSPHSGATYPSAWSLQVPSEQIDLKLVPVIPDQEIDARASTGNFYWEGAVRALAGNKPAGRGYVELTGYAPGGFADLASQFKPGPNLCRRPDS